ncbi:MAG: cation:proton antiporter [Gemmatimonadaceae bacterium]
MTAESFAATLALIGIVILVSSLLSGAVERSGAPQVAIFLALGAVLGPVGLGLLDFTLESPALRAIAILGLVLVLFSDAISVDAGDVRRQRRLALLILGPGTLLPAVVVALAAWWLLRLPLAAAGVLGAALASTDPVLLRALLRRQDIPTSARLALRLESGLNDAVLLPVVVLCMLFLNPEVTPSGREIARHTLGLFVLGPGAGAAVGWLAITMLEQVRKRTGVRRDYESMYALGVAFTAYAVAEAVGGSGFLAAFAAGLVIAALDVELCDCFLDYGEATAEMFLLLTFVAFGASLIWVGLTVLDARTLLFAVIALAVRTVVLLPILRHAGVDARSRRLIAWFGPRGLSTLLLVLLPVFAGVPGSERLFTVSSLVVLLSVVLHGGGIAIYVRRREAEARAARTPVISAIAANGAAATSATVVSAGATLGAPSVGRALPVADLGPRASEGAADGWVPEKITVDELRQLWSEGASVVLLDVRTERSFRLDPVLARGAIRMPPDEAVAHATERQLSRDATLAAYCA